MKFYLSSYRLGNKTGELKKLILHNKIGYIPNARDYSAVVDPEIKKNRTERDIALLSELGVGAEVIDLSNYFRL